MNYTFATVIIKDQYKEQAKNDIGEEFFSAGLSVDGKLPASHWLSSGAFNNDELNKICNECIWDKKVLFGQDWQSILINENLKLIVE